MRRASILFLCALAPRLAYNLAVHPLGTSLNTDMGSYAAGVRSMLDQPLGPNPPFAFWPFGTGWLGAFVQMIAGRESWNAVGVLYAFLGAGAAVLAWDTARRVSRHAAVAWIVAVLGVVYYPWIMMSGFFMSEPPFAFLLALQAWSAVRWVQGGTWRDAAGFGVAAAVGAVFRPPMLVSAVLTLAALGAARWPGRERWREVAAAGAPLVLGLALSTAYLHHNSGRFGLISHNGPFNLVFGRCHNHALSWNTRGSNGAFSPAGLLHLHRAEVAAAEQGGSFWLSLDPALRPEINVRTRPSDAGPLMDLVRDCVRQTGPIGQMRYSLTNVLLLWNANQQFPGMSDRWSRRLEGGWRTVDQVLFQVPLLLGLWFLIGDRKEMRIVAANGAAMVVTAALYFGEIRLRLPYMGMVWILSLELLADAGALAWPHVRERWAQRR